MLLNILAAARSLFSPSMGANRRRYRRYRRCTLVTIQELDNDLSPLAGIKWAMSRDIHHHGIGLICPQRIDVTYVRVTVMEDKFSKIGVVRHCQPADDGGSTYLIGIEFLDDEVCQQK